MTTPTDLPTAQQALALAFGIVRDPCSPAEAQRAEILLGIAREIREEQQFRTVAARRYRLDRAAAEGKLEAAGIPMPESTTLRGYLDRFTRSQPAAVEVRPDETAAERAAWLVQKGLRTGGVITDPSTTAALVGEGDVSVTAYMPALAEQTQRLPVPWKVGDKADCKNCHTPIELYEAETSGAREDRVSIWRHRYSGQAVCVNASIDEGHTFAEPSR